MKTLVITGAGRGIGLATVKRFLENPDYMVIATSRNTDNLQELNQDRLIIITGNLLKDYHKIVDGITHRTSRVDILINNAGLVLNQSIINTSDAELNDVMNTNFSAPYKLIRDLGSLFHSKSHILNISSMSGYQGSRKFPGLTAYSSSKAALASLTECVAEEWREREIYCNCLALGAVDTDMIRVSIPGMKPVVTADQMADYIYEFALKGHTYYNGQVIPVTLATL